MSTSDDDPAGLDPVGPDLAGRDLAALDLAALDLAGLDLASKVRLLTGASTFVLHGDERLGLQPLALSDGPTGVRGVRFTGGPKASLLPCATVLASSWDPDLLRQAGDLLAQEAARQRVGVVLGPTINLHRSPLGGRLFEAFSEDPLLTGRLAAAYVRGLQDAGTGACLKHLVANESETERHTVDVQVDEATLRELYLLPFQIAVEDADPWSVMAAYNAVGGVPATEHAHVLLEVLKGEWGWSGLVVSDWYAATSAGPAANGGLDLVMPGPDGPWGAALVAAVEAGEVAEAVVDEHLRRLLRLADRAGALGAGRTWPTGLPEPDSAVRRSQLLRMAAAGTTVLTNDGTLPLEDPATRVVLVGRHALETVCMGGGSAQLAPPHQVPVAEGLAALLGDRLVVVDGVEVRARPVPAVPGVVVDPVDGRPGMRVRLLDADGALLLEEHVDEARRLVGFDDELPRRAATVRLSARVELTGRVQLGVIGAGTWVLRAGARTEHLDLQLAGDDPGEEVLQPPSGTLEAELDGPTLVEAELTTGDVRFTMVGLVARPAPRPDVQALADAVAAARTADVAVVVVGLTEEQETESRDKTTLALPGAQDALVEAVLAAAPRTVVVVNAATPVLLPWADRAAAVVVVGLPGQEGGHAVAAALTGALEPTGRLVTSWPVEDGATPAWSVTPVDGVLAYREGPFVGYRGHAAGLAPAPRFWFGHGLGYGRWEHPAAELVPGGRAVAVTVRNTASRAAREVVQVYLEPAAPTAPVRLVGWAVADVEPGATETVLVACDARACRRWDTADGAWAALPGPGALLVARGLGDVRHRLPLADLAPLADLPVTDPGGPPPSSWAGTGR